MNKVLKTRKLDSDDCIHLFFILIVVISGSIIIIGLIEFIINQNLLNFIIFTSLSLFVDLIMPIFLYIIIKNNKIKLDSFMRERKYVLISVPIFIFIFILITIISKQYCLTIYISIILCGYVFGYIITPKFKKRYQIISRIILTLIIISIIIPFGFLARGTFESRNSSQIWVMHKIDNPGFILPNGLDSADVNNDSFSDYLTNYEWDGKIRIAFHPGILKVKNPWPAITISTIDNAESAAFGDFDGDGNFDVVVAYGSELFSHSGIFLIWGPTPDNATNPSAWIRGDNIE